MIRSIYHLHQVLVYLLTHLHLDLLIHLQLNLEEMDLALLMVDMELQEDLVVWAGWEEAVLVHLIQMGNLEVLEDNLEAQMIALED